MNVVLLGNIDRLNVKFSPNVGDIESYHYPVLRSMCYGVRMGATDKSKYWNKAKRGSS